jgi:predicted Rossmann fold flavoprotein
LPAIQKYGFNEIKDFYNFLGITLTIDDDGKAYPMSKQASSVLDVMRAYLDYKNTNIITNYFVTDIKKTDDGYILTSSMGEVICAKTILLCTGGEAQKQFGTDGNGYNLAKVFGHKITPVYPSLVQLKTDSPLIKGLRGLKADATVYAISNGKVVKSATGEVLFTDYGVSGNAIFKISGYLSKAKNPEVKISFVPSLSLDELSDKIETRFTSQPYLKVEDALTGLVNKLIGRQIIKTANDTSSYSIAFATKNFTLPITGNLGFNYAQVTKGGVSTLDIDKLTMQSKLTAGLYVVGELLDVDGDCGGYN